VAGRYTPAGEALARAIEHARRAGNERLLARSRAALALNSLQGPLPVPQAIAECEQLLAAGLRDRQLECNVLCALAQLRAMNGEIDSARALMRRSRAMLRDLGQGVFVASTGIDLARVELHGGDLALAQREVRADCDFLAAKGETYFLSTLMALLARIVREQGRDEEALALTREAEAATAPDDTESQALWRMVRAPILARAGEATLAEQLAREALDLVRRTEAPMLQGDALAELAAVLAVARRGDEARSTAAEAISLYEAKGNRVAAARAAAWADALTT
jgi:ATP/maltotriose-dependent transcriptional regulator MalT